MEWASNTEKWQRKTENRIQYILTCWSCWCIHGWCHWCWCHCSRYHNNWCRLLARWIWWCRRWWWWLPSNDILCIGQTRLLTKIKNEMANCVNWWKFILKKIVLVIFFLFVIRTWAFLTPHQNCNFLDYSYNFPSAHHIL